MRDCVRDMNANMMRQLSGMREEKWHSKSYHGHPGCHGVLPHEDDERTRVHRNAFSNRQPPDQNCAKKRPFKSVTELRVSGDVRMCENRLYGVCVCVCAE